MAAANDRRKKVLVGELPADFLRFHAPPAAGAGGGGGVEDGRPMTQLEADEEAALALQQQLNGVVGRQRQQQQPMIFYTQANMVPPNTRGRLTVTLLQAKLTRNYGLVRMDPYCRLRVGNTVFETPTDVSGGKNPKWNRTVHCFLPEGVETIFLEIFDERAFTTDERVAWGHVSIPEAVFNMETIEDWYPLSGSQGDGKEGMVQLAIAFTQLDAPPPVSYIPVNPQQTVVVGGGAPPGQPVPGNVPPAAGGLPTGVELQQVSRPAFTEEDVKEMQDMFPNMDVEVIKSVFEEKRGNKDAIVNALLSLSDD